MRVGVQARLWFLATPSISGVASPSTRTAAHHPRGESSKEGKEWQKQAGQRKTTAAKTPKTKPKPKAPQNATLEAGGALGPQGAQDHLGIAYLQDSAELLPGIPDGL